MCSARLDTARHGSTRHWGPGGQRGVPSLSISMSPESALPVPRECLRPFPRERVTPPSQTMQGMTCRPRDETAHGLNRGAAPARVSRDTRSPPAARAMTAAPAAPGMNALHGPWRQACRHGPWTVKRQACRHPRVSSWSMTASRSMATSAAHPCARIHAAHGYAACCASCPSIPDGLAGRWVGR